MKIDIEEVDVLGEYSSLEWGIGSDEIECVCISKMVIDNKEGDVKIKKILTIITDVDAEHVLKMYTTDWDQYEEDEINRIIKNR